MDRNYGRNLTKEYLRMLPAGTTIREQKIQSKSDYRCLSWHVVSVPGTFLLWYFINAWAFLYVKYPSWASYNDYNNKNLLHGKGKRTRKRMVRKKAYGKLLGNTIEELGGE